MKTNHPAKTAAKRKRLVARIAAAQKQATRAKQSAKLARFGYRRARKAFKDAKHAARKLRKAVKSLQSDLEDLPEPKPRHKRAAARSAPKHRARSGPGPAAPVVTAAGMPDPPEIPLGAPAQ